jgi:hypothetical protein
MDSIVTEEQENYFEVERANYIKRKVIEKKVDDEKELFESYINDIVNIFYNYPDRVIKNDFVYNQYCIAILRSEIDSEILSILNQKKPSKMKQRLEAYYSRIKNNFLPTIVHIVTYLKGVEVLEEKSLRQICKFLNNTFVQFHEYAKQVVVNKKPGFNDFSQKDYKLYIINSLKHHYKKSITNNKGISDIYYHYPSKTKLYNDVKYLFSLDYGEDKFEVSMYNKVIETLIQGETIKEFSTNPDTGKNFVRNANKIVWWDKDKQAPKGMK